MKTGYTNLAMTAMVVCGAVCALAVGALCIMLLVKPL